MHYLNGNKSRLIIPHCVNFPPCVWIQARFLGLWLAGNPYITKRKTPLSGNLYPRWGSGWNRNGGMIPFFKPVNWDLSHQPYTSTAP